MNIVDALLNKVPNVFWVNMAKTLMQEICDSVINDTTDPTKQRHTKAVILSVFEKFLNNNFSADKTSDLAKMFESEFLIFIMKNAKHPMDNFFENDYMNLLVFKKILDTDASLFSNVLKTAIAKTELNGDDSSKSKAKKVIQFIKDQLKPIDLNGPIPLEQSGGTSPMLKDINDAIQLLAEMRPTINKTQFDKLNTKLKNIHKFVLVSKGGTIGEDVKKADVSALTTSMPFPTPTVTLNNPINTPKTIDIFNTIPNKLTNNIISKNPLHKISEQLPNIQNPNTLNSVEVLKQVPALQALQSFGPNGLNLPASDDISTKIVDEIFNNFSPTEGKEYKEIREDIYKQFMDALNAHLHGPEGRQMYLRIIDPFLTKCISEVINSGAVAIFLIVYLISKVYKVSEMVEGALTTEFDKTTNPTEQTAEDVYTQLDDRLSKVLEHQNPLNELYNNMKTMGYDIDTIKQKQYKDYDKTLCSQYASIVDTPSTLPTPIAPIITNILPDKEIPPTKQQTQTQVNDISENKSIPEENTEPVDNTYENVDKSKDKEDNDVINDTTTISHENGILSEKENPKIGGARHKTCKKRHSGHYKIKKTRHYR